MIKESKLAIAISSPSLRVPTYRIASIESKDFSFFISRMTPLALSEIVSLSLRNLCESPQRTNNNSGMPSFVLAEQGTRATLFVKS